MLQQLVAASELVLIGSLNDRVVLLLAELFLDRLHQLALVHFATLPGLC